MIAPSTKRWFLAAFIDYLLFTGIYEPIAWVIVQISGPRLGFVVSLAAFAVVRSTVVRIAGATPGRWALGITSDPTSWVDETMLARETWWSMLLGTLFILEGAKNLVRWTQGLPPPPLLGSATPEEFAFLTVSLFGLVGMIAGVMILRTHAHGPRLGAFVLAMELWTTIANRDAFRDWAPQVLAARRALQGRPLRAGEVELAQSLLSVGTPILATVGLLCLAAMAVRFRRRSGT